MSLTPEQENLKKVWLAKRDRLAVDVGTYAEWAAEEALLDALGNCIEAGFDPRNFCSEVCLSESEEPCTLPPPDPEPPVKPMTLTPEQENLKKVWLAQHELAALHVAAYEKAWEEVRGGDIISAPSSIHMAKARLALVDALWNCIEAGFDPRNLCSVTPLPDFPLPEPLPKSNPCSEVYLPVSEKPCSLTPPDPEPPAKPMTKYNRTIRTVIITPEGDTGSPLFSERAVVVTVEDDAGGPFIVLTTGDDISGRGEIRLDAEELWEVAKVAKELMEQETLRGGDSVTPPDWGGLPPFDSAENAL